MPTMMEMNASSLAKAKKIMQNENDVVLDNE